MFYEEVSSKGTSSSVPLLMSKLHLSGGAINYKQSFDIVLFLGRKRLRCVAFHWVSNVRSAEAGLHRPFPLLVQVFISFLSENRNLQVKQRCHYIYDQMSKEVFNFFWWCLNWKLFPHSCIGFKEQENNKIVFGLSMKYGSKTNKKPHSVHLWEKSCFIFLGFSSSPFFWPQSPLLLALVSLVTTTTLVSACNCFLNGKCTNIVSQLTMLLPPLLLKSFLPKTHLFCDSSAREAWLSPTALQGYFLYPCRGLL